MDVTVEGSFVSHVSHEEALWPGVLMCDTDTANTTCPRPRSAAF